MPAQNAIGPADNLPVCCVAVLSGDRDKISILIVLYQWHQRVLLTGSHELNIGNL